MNCNVQS